MNLFFDCLPCMLKQLIEASRRATEDQIVQTAIIRDGLILLKDFQRYPCAPLLGEGLHHLVKQHTGIRDPYRNTKDKDISEALRLEPLIASLSQNISDPFLNALKCSATGNVMDSALYSDLNLESCLRDELARPFQRCDLDAFKTLVHKSKTILIIGDNAGEVVFDKVLVRLLKHQKGIEKIFYAVRSEPIINDATLEDAVKAGMDKLATIVSSGCSAPGTVLEHCSNEFKQLFYETDIIISKGQGNLEALSDVKRSVFFLLKAKCPKIASVLRVDLGAYVFQLGVRESGMDY